MEVKRLREEVKSHSLSKEAVNVLLNILEDFEERDIIEVN